MTPHDRRSEARYLRDINGAAMRAVTRIRKRFRYRQALRAQWIYLDRPEPWALYKSHKTPYRCPLCHTKPLERIVQIRPNAFCLFLSCCRLYEQLTAPGTLEAAETAYLNLGY